jgi:hypothetical protein
LAGSGAYCSRSVIDLHPYINLDLGVGPTRLPEYGIDLGPALGPLPARYQRLI